MHCIELKTACVVHMTRVLGNVEACCSMHNCIMQDRVSISMDSHSIVLNLKRRSLLHEKLYRQPKVDKYTSKQTWPKVADLMSLMMLNCRPVQWFLLKEIILVLDFAAGRCIPDRLSKFLNDLPRSMYCISLDGCLLVS